MCICQLINLLYQLLRSDFANLRWLGILLSLWASSSMTAFVVVYFTCFIGHFIYFSFGVMLYSIARGVNFIIAMAQFVAAHVRLICALLGSLGK